MKRFIQGEPKEKRRNFLYNGETVWIEGIFDAVKVSTYKNHRNMKNFEETEKTKDIANLGYENAFSCEYVSGGRGYAVPPTVDAIKFEYIELTKSIDCCGKYCISNGINITDEKILKSEIFSVIPPVQIVEKVQGNYFIAKITNDASVSSEVQSKAVVSINGMRMEFKNNSYSMRIQRITDWGKPIYITVDFEQIHYSRESFVSLPKDFMYSIDLKKIGETHFIRMTLCRLLAETYVLDILNPTVEKKDIEDAKKSKSTAQAYAKDTEKSEIEITEDRVNSVSILDLKVYSPSPQIIIDSPEYITEVLLEVLKKQETQKTYLFAIKVNSYPVEFCVTI